MIVPHAKIEKILLETVDSSKLAAQYEPFDSYWEGPKDIEKGYSTVVAFYEDNYLKRMPSHKDVKILVVSCGPGYFLKLLNHKGYSDVYGIDSEPKNIDLAQNKGFSCGRHRAFEFLQGKASNTYEVIFCEQELNHLTKGEMTLFVQICVDKLVPGGRLICHGLNGANPITGAEALAQNFDHYNTFTSYTFNQVFSHNGLEKVEVFPLNLYVFWKNPLNYILIAITSIVHLVFRAFFIIYGKHNKIWTKKIGSMGFKPK